MLRLELEAEDYRVAWVCPLPDVELPPARLMLDYEYEAPKYNTDYDKNTYIFGSICGHATVIATMPKGRTGNVNAARIAGPLRGSFPSIRIILLVGIGGAIPFGGKEYDGSADLPGNIFLGDVVVGAPGDGGPSVIHYDHGRTKKEGFEIVGKDIIARPDDRILSGLAVLKANYDFEGECIFDAAITKLMSNDYNKERFREPSRSTDLLFESSYDPGSEHLYGDCSACDHRRLIKRPARPVGGSHGLVFHFGRVASGNSVIQVGTRRDEIGRLCDGAICIEMEAAGVDTSAPCLVIRGISDYSDTHKNDLWKPYAAGQAAVFARTLLGTIQPNDIRSAAIYRNSGLARLLKDLDLVRRLKSTGGKHDDNGNDDFQLALQSLEYEDMNITRCGIQPVKSDTVSWLFAHPVFKEWRDGKHQDRNKNLIALIGGPGTGKSTLMKEAFEKLSEVPDTARPVASFFFGRESGSKEVSMSVMLRSLLHQLLPQIPSQQAQFTRLWRAKPRSKSWTWTVAELRMTFLRMLEEPTPSRVFVFVDAIDESDSRDTVYPFFLDTIRMNFSGKVPLSKSLAVCVSHRLRYNPYTVHIRLEDHNNQAIVAFVERELDISVGHGDDRELLATEIVRKAKHCFLWASLVLREIRIQRARGRNLMAQLEYVEVLPAKLGQIYTSILRKIQPELRPVSLRLFQWALLSCRPLHIYEWHHILPFISEKPPLSLSEWKSSSDFTGEWRKPKDSTSRHTAVPVADDNMLEARIAELSGGLIKVDTISPAETGDDLGYGGGQSATSAALAGSFDMHSGAYRIVKPRHETVYEYFLKSPWDGFKLLGEPSPNPVPLGHCSIMNTMLDYIKIRDLDDFLMPPSDRDYRSVGSKFSSVNSSRYLDTPDDRFSGDMDPEFDSTAKSYASRSSSGSGSTIADRYVHGKPSMLIQPWDPRGLTRNEMKPENRALSDGLISLAAEALGNPRLQWTQKWLNMQLGLRNVRSDPELDQPKPPIPPSTVAHAMLAESPDLLAYISSAFFSHATRSPSSSDEVRPLVTRLSADKTWERLSSLCGAETSGSSLIYQAHKLKLAPWIEVLVGTSTPQQRIAAVHEAIVKRKSRILKMILMDFESLVSDVDETGASLLSHAVVLLNTSASFVLIDHGADVSAARSSLLSGSANACAVDSESSSEVKHVRAESTRPFTFVLGKLLRHCACKDARRRSAKHETAFDRPCEDLRSQASRLKDTEECEGEEKALMARIQLIGLMGDYHLFRSKACLDSITKHFFSTFREFNQAPFSNSRRSERCMMEIANHLLGVLSRTATFAWDDLVRDWVGSCGQYLKSMGQGTLLHYSATLDIPGLTAAVIRHGIDTSKLDRRGRTALQVATEHGNNAVVAVLLEHQRGTGITFQETR
ncbi:hypothetical protein ACKVWH_010505 [Pyricularia oryzae]